MSLRFRREWVSDERTQRVLQQAFLVREIDEDGDLIDISIEWRDVPLED